MIIFVVAGVVLAVAALIVLIVSLFRSKSARSDWLGELSDIRRSSLSDDDEVTGAMQAIDGGDYDDEPQSEAEKSIVDPGFLTGSAPEDEASSGGDDSDDEPRSQAEESIVGPGFLTGSAPEDEASATGGDIDKNVDDEADPASLGGGERSLEPSSESSVTEADVESVDPSSYLIPDDPESTDVDSLGSLTEPEVAESAELSESAESNVLTESAELSESAESNVLTESAELSESAEDSELAEVIEPIELARDDASATIAPGVLADAEGVDSNTVFDQEAATVKANDTLHEEFPRMQVVTDEPDRVVVDGDATFHEYDRPDGAVVRVDATSSDTLRVVVGAIASGADTCAVDLVSGTLWFRPGSEDRPLLSCSVRTPAGWVTTSDAVVLVQVESSGWSYAMCLEGTATLDYSGQELKVMLEAGQIGRGRSGGTGFEVAKVGVDTLEHEEVVKRHRMLDAR